MDRTSVYIETSIVSYLTARPTNDLLAAARKAITVDWWEKQKSRFNLYTSDLSVLEAGRGNPEAASRRLGVLSTIHKLEITSPVIALANALLEERALPAKAQDDAVHIVASSVHGMDYLMTWNCRHIDNAETKPIMRRICAVHGYTSPEICTPEELMGVAEDV